MSLHKLLKQLKKNKVHDFYYSGVDRTGVSLDQASKLLHMNKTEILLFRIMIMEDMLNKSVNQ